MDGTGHDQLLSIRLIPNVSQVQTKGGRFSLSTDRSNEEKGEIRRKAYEGSDIPKAVVNCGYTTAMLGVTDFRQKQRRRKLCQTIPEAHENTAGHKHWTFVRTDTDTPTF